MLRSAPGLPRSFATGPQLFQVGPVTKRIHGLPEPVVLKSHQFTIYRQLLQGVLFPDGVIILQVLKYTRREHEKATVNHGAVALGLFHELPNLAALNTQRAEA